MENENNRTASKEDLARQIARNMAMKADDDYAQTENRYDTRTAVKSKPQGYDDDDEREQRPHTNKKKRKKKSGTGKVVAVVIIVLIFVVGFGLGAYYLNGMSKVQGKFLSNTYINGIDVSGKTQKEAYDLVTAESVIPEEITIIKLDGSTFTINLDDIGYVDNVKTTISQYYSQQNHYMWFKYNYTTTEYNFASTFTYDKSLLEAELERKITDSPGTTEPQNAYIKSTDNGFEIVKEVKGDRIDESKLSIVYEYVEGNVDSGEYEIDLSTLNIYQEPDVLAEDLEAQLEKLNSLSEMQISFDFTYTTETLEGSTIMEWLTFDESDSEGGYSVDADKAMEYVEYLADKYDTYGKSRTFTSTTRGEMTIEEGEGCYGWWIDQQETCDLIVELVEAGESANVEPIYYVNPNSNYSYTCNPEWRTADSDIGNTYCEIDLAEQHFWYYENGELAYECDIVSGLPTEERKTPAGVYKVWYKELDKTLTGTTSSGESWSTPVTYWNNISTFGVGLHDTVRRSAFGGSIYKTNGSHGCINMPLAAAKYVYENVEINTPVIIYE